MKKQYTTKNIKQGLRTKLQQAKKNTAVDCAYSVVEKKASKAGGRKAAKLAAPFLMVAVLLHANSLWQQRSLYNQPELQNGEVVTIVVEIEDSVSFQTATEGSRSNNANIEPFGVQPKTTGSQAATTPAGTGQEGGETTPQSGAQETQQPPAAKVKTEQKSPNALRAYPRLPGMKNNYSTKSAFSFKGDSQKGVSLVIAATVKNINNNGTVELEAVQNLQIKGQTQTIRLTGMANIQDINNNSIGVKRVANLTLSIATQALTRNGQITRQDLPQELQDLPANQIQILLNYLNSLGEHIYQ